GLADVTLQHGWTGRVVGIERADAYQQIAVPLRRIGQEAVVPAVERARLDRRRARDAVRPELAQQMRDGPLAGRRTVRLLDGGIRLLIVAVDVRMAIDHQRRLVRRSGAG